MRGSDDVSGSLFSYVDLEDRIPFSHPLRKTRVIVNKALSALDAEFAKLYAVDGRPSIAPERLLRAAIPSPTSETTGYTASAPSTGAKLQAQGRSRRRRAAGRRGELGRRRERRWRRP